jgi:hypothetical protein
MSLFKTITLGALVLVGTIGAASAHDARRIEHIQARQRAAVEEGRWNGSITKREQRNLIAEQERIDALRRRAKADGHVSAREAREIRNAQRNARVRIAETRSNLQVNLWRRWKTKRGL